MLDVLNIGSRLFKGTIQKMVVRAIKNSLGIDVDLNLENLSVRHSDGENVQFSITINGSLTEGEFKKLVEKALK